MKRITGVVLAVAVVAVAVVAASAGGQGAQGRTIKLRELATGETFHYVDNPPRGARPNRPRVSVGDFFAFSSPVASMAGRRVGHLDVQCVITAGRRFATARQACHGGYKLPHGQITLQAVLVGEQKTVRAAVTGGTGAYAGARGVLTSISKKRGAVDTITLLP